MPVSDGHGHGHKVEHVPEHVPESWRVPGGVELTNTRKVDHNDVEVAAPAMSTMSRRATSVPVFTHFSWRSRSKYTSQYRTSCSHISSSPASMIWGSRYRPRIVMVTGTPAVSNP